MGKGKMLRTIVWHGYSSTIIKHASTSLSSERAVICFVLFPNTFVSIYNALSTLLQLFYYYTIIFFASIHRGMLSYNTTWSK